MRASKFFYKTLREDPKDAEATSHKLLIRASMIKQIASGVYAFLPFGHKVLKKIETVVREEMDRIGGQEMTMSIMMPAERWKKTGQAVNKIVDIWANRYIVHNYRPPKINLPQLRLEEL